jgi:putative FmdB family regulatory protein
LVGPVRFRDEESEHGKVTGVPRYEYKCKSCKKNFEAVHGFDEKVSSCEYCGGPVRRVFHPVGIVFKGSGFYATDSRKSTDKKFKPAEEEAPAAKAASGDNGSKKDKEKEKEEKSPESTKAPS